MPFMSDYEEPQASFTLANKDNDLSYYCRCHQNGCTTLSR